jgi:hypothetical protein
MVHGRVYTISSDKASPGRLINNLHWKVHMSIGAQRRARSAIAVMQSHGGVMSLNPDPEAGQCLSNRLHLYYLTGVHVTNRVIECSLICNRNLAYDEGTRLDCCNEISVTGELGMAIITLGRLYFMLSCRLTPTDVASM